MQVHIECMNRLPPPEAAGPADPELENVLDIMQNDFPRLWEDLWQIRTPFLDSDVACEEPEFDPVATLHNTLQAFAESVGDQLELRRYVHRATYAYVPDVCSSEG